MIELENVSTNCFTQIYPLQKTPQEEKQIQEAKVCWLCENSCDKDEVRDHDHLT